MAKKPTDQIVVHFDSARFALKRLERYGYDKWPIGKSTKKMTTLGADGLLIVTADLRKQFHLVRVAHSNNPEWNVERFAVHPRGLTDTNAAISALQAVDGVTAVKFEKKNL